MNRFLSAGLLATLCFLISCDEDLAKEPDYPIEPFIENPDLKFVEGPHGNWSIDSLILSFYFRDGDMDLGLDYRNLHDLDSPYHALNYFLEDNGDIVKIGTKRRYDNFPALLNIPKNQTGKLVTIRTRKKPGYDFLPEYVSPFSCSSYTPSYLDTVFVSAENKNIFDNTYALVDSFHSLTHPTIYALSDTFYYEVNENHYSILVDYLVKQPDGSFVEFDWRKEFCSNYDGRFPYLNGIKKGMTVVDGPFKIRGYSSKDGQLRYTMLSTGFKMLFGGKTIKIRVKIKDHALHDSNVIETNEIEI